MFVCFYDAFSYNNLRNISLKLKTFNILASFKMLRNAKIQKIMNSIKYLFTNLYHI